MSIRITSSIDTIIYSYPVTWIITASSFIIYYLYRKRKTGCHKQLIPSFHTINIKFIFFTSHIKGRSIQTSFCLMNFSCFKAYLFPFFLICQNPPPITAIAAARVPMYRPTEAVSPDFTFPPVGFPAEPRPDCLSV